MTEIKKESDMREIKFRAWDKQNKIMRSLETAFLGKNGYYIVDDMPGFEKMLPSAHLRDFELMQYTGLKDKNGVEIYESDIVDDGKGAGVIEWCSPIAAFVVRPIKPAEFAVYQLNKGNTVGPTTLVESEVIGNIYENPELLVTQ